jgi:two-component system, sensor histidine kinase and response regulator
VLMVTSARLRRETERSRASGVHAFLTKPIRQSQVHRALVTALGGPAPSGSQRASARRLSTVHRPLRVLLAEDNPVNQKLTVSILHREGHEVVLAENGRQAVEALHAAGGDPFDLILMDVEMPVMSGLEATKQIRQDERASGTNVPIIALTARAMAGDREACFAAGMDGYLTKPMRADQLFAAIAAVIHYSSSDDESVDDGVSQASSSGAVGESTKIAGDRSGASDALDYARLVNMLGDDTELANQLIEIFEHNMPAQMDEIRDGHQRTDRSAIVAAAHKLKGAAVTVCADAIAQAADDLEQGGRTANADRLTSMIASLEAAVRGFSAQRDEPRVAQSLIQQ